MSDDSDDDIPIALLMKRKIEQDKSKAGPTAEAKKPSKSDSKEKEKKRPSSDGDDAAKKKAKPSAEKPSSTAPAVPKLEKKKDAEPAKPSKPKAEPAMKKPKKEPSSNGSSKPATVARDAVEENIFGLPRMDKHNLVSAVLRRWKYCLDAWPGDNLPKEPPGYIEAHVPGLYVGMSNLVLGQLKDVRPSTPGKTPSMASLLTLKAVELRDLLIKGISAQLNDLGSNPDDDKLKAKLRHELEKAEKLKVKKIERKYREAIVALGSAGANVPQPPKAAGDDAKDDKDDDE